MLEVRQFQIYLNLPLTQLMWQKQYKWFTNFQEHRFMRIRSSETRVESLSAFFIKKAMPLSKKKLFTIYQSRHRSDVTPSTYVQLSRGHFISTNSVVNSQSFVLISLISIDVETEVSCLTNICRYTAWKHIKNSFSSYLSTLNVRSTYTYIRTLIKLQRIHKIQNAISSQARCLVFSAILILGAFTKLRKETIRFVMSVYPSFRTENFGEYFLNICLEN